MSPLWDDFEAVTCPLLLVRGSVSPVVDDDDEAEARAAPRSRCAWSTVPATACGAIGPSNRAAIIESRLAG